MSARRAAATAVAALCLLALASATVSAATLKVTTTTDELIVNGSCSLREAILAANTDAAVDSCPAGTGADRIILPAGSYVLTLTGSSENAGRTGDLDVTSDVTILGSGPADTIIDGGAFEYPLMDRVFHVAGTGRLDLSKLTVQRGVCSAGGGVFNAGSLILRDSAVRDNVASEGADVCAGAAGGGAGVYNTGQVTIVRSILSRNEVHGGFGPSDVAYPGGALLNRGSATVEASSIVDNYAAGGGGIRNYGQLLVRQTLIGSNRARFYGAGVETEGQAELSGSTVSNNVDGGIRQHSGTLRLLNVTLSGNNSLRVAGALHATGGTVDIVASTIADNRGVVAPNCDELPCPLPVAGIGAAAVTLVNTIVSNPGYGDCWQPVITLGNNLDRDGTCGLTAGGDLSATDPRLGPLAANGGPTATHALLAGSPAIDHIPRYQCVVQTDQRSVPRPQPDPKHSLCDIGAYELTLEGESSVDMGNADDEALHALEGWGGVNLGPLPPGIPSDGTSRYQLLRGSNSVTLPVPLPGSAHVLSFRTEDGICDDSFDVHLDDSGAIYSYAAVPGTPTFFPLHEVPLLARQLTGDVARITFVNTASDQCGLAAVYFVRLTAGRSVPKTQ